MFVSIGEGESGRDDVPSTTHSLSTRVSQNTLVDIPDYVTSVSKSWIKVCPRSFLVFVEERMGNLIL